MVKVQLQALLQERGMTQANLARLTGIRPSTICDLYHNSADRINLAHLDRICRVPGCQIAEVLKRQHISIYLTFYLIIASEAYKKIIKDLSWYTKATYFGNLRQHLLSFVIYTYIANVSKEPNIPIVADSAIVNRFKRKNAILTIENCVLTIAKTQKPGVLPHRSQYMIDLAHNNGENDLQLALEYPNGNIHRPPYYGIIVYRYLNDSYQFIEIVMPNSNVNTILTTVPIYGQNAKIQITQTDLDENDIVQLTNDV